MWSEQHYGGKGRQERPPLALRSVARTHPQGVFIRRRSLETVTLMVHGDDKDDDGTLDLVEAVESKRHLLWGRATTTSPAD